MDGNLKMCSVLVLFTKIPMMGERSARGKKGEREKKKSIGATRKRSKESSIENLEGI